jgi:hypothetical protein
MTEEKSTDDKQRSKKVVPVYYDYANEVEKVAESVEFQRCMDEHPQLKCDEGSFPVKLHDMLSEMEADGMDGIVSWQPHGRCFVVHDHMRFVEQVLPL